MLSLLDFHTSVCKDRGEKYRDEDMLLAMWLISGRFLNFNWNAAARATAKTTRTCRSHRTCLWMSLPLPSLWGRAPMTMMSHSTAPIGGPWTGWGGEQLSAGDRVGRRDRRSVVDGRQRPRGDVQLELGAALAPVAWRSLRLLVQVYRFRWFSTLQRLNLQ